MYHYSPVSDAFAVILFIAIAALVFLPFWTPLLFYTISAIHDMQRERLIERREREEREARIRMMNAVTQQAQQPTLPAPYYQPLPPPAQPPQPWVVEQPQTTLVPRRQSRVISLAHALDHLMGEDK